MTRRRMQSEIYLLLAGFMFILMVADKLGYLKSTLTDRLVAAPGSQQLILRSGSERKEIPPGALIEFDDGRSGQFGRYRLLVAERLVLEMMQDSIVAIDPGQVKRVYLQEDKTIISGLTFGILGYGVGLAITSEYLYTSCGGDVYRYHNDKALALGVPVGIGAGYVARRQYLRNVHDIGPDGWELSIQ